VIIIMPARVLIVAATKDEADAADRIFVPDNTSKSILITGVGTVATTWAMARWISSNPRPDLAINIGLAGSYKKSINPGDVVMPVTDCFADAGIETSEGFSTLAEAGLVDPDMFPFSKGMIVAGNRFVRKAEGIVKSVDAITVNTASGTAATIDRLRTKYDPDIETMEGAAFFYVCSMSDMPFIALRAVSNIVEPRNRDKWEIRLALDNLALKLKEILVKHD